MITSCLGNPCVARICLNSSTVLAVVVEVIGITSGYFEWASTTIRNIVATNRLAKSTWIHCHSHASHSQGSNWAASGLELFWMT